MQNSERSAPAPYGNLVYRAPVEPTHQDDEDGATFWMACALVGVFIVIAVTFVAATGLGAPQ
ncbi:hypothetical protein [Paracidovorax wautersii]|uniref:Uncharacterized protein n=1 Tax=Paracidovorax wautersii TaxID=1177982 RepID=A0ABU1IFC0_9BURK|nr:hypothetical protein [Paracidovorax wautersii]MDR6215926.1 hypothetical protein [Paracidovorax wautersii]